MPNRLTTLVVAAVLLGSAALGATLGLLGAGEDHMRNLRPSIVVDVDHAAAEAAVGQAAGGDPAAPADTTSVPLIEPGASWSAALDQAAAEQAAAAQAEADRLAAQRAAAAKAKASTPKKAAPKPISRDDDDDDDDDEWDD